MPRQRRSPDEALSRALTQYLRHGGADAGADVGFRPDAFVRLATVARFVPEASDTEAVRRVVRDSDKRRLSLLEEGGTLWIRANQGHSGTFARLIDPAQLLESLPWAAFDAAGNRDVAGDGAASVSPSTNGRIRS